MIRFEFPLFLWLLALTPVWIFIFYWMQHQRLKAAAQFIGKPLLEKVAYSHNFRRGLIRGWLWATIWILVVIGIANPQVGTKLEEVKREGIDIVIALDLSTSMLCEDFSPSRIENAKHEILKFVSGLKGDRVGLVAFAGSAIVHCPLTDDYGAVKLLVKIMDPNLVPEPGTALADAIESAQKSFNLPEVHSKVIVIITDGEDHEERAVEAAKKANEDGIRIYTIGMGTPSGAPIPLKNAGSKGSDFQRDQTGEVVVTKLNEILLTKIADAGQGRYLRGTQGGQELEAIWTDINSMEKQEFGKKQFTAFEDRFQYAVFPALLLLLSEFFISERRSASGWKKKWFKGWSFRKGSTIQ